MLSGKSTATFLTFEVAVSKSYVDKLMGPVWRAIFSFALFTLIVTLPLSLLFAYKAAGPMRKLLADMESMTSRIHEDERILEALGFIAGDNAPSQAQSRAISKLGTEVLEFIDNHLEDTLLYIPMIAEHFKISKPTLQKLVKAVAGETVSSYIEKKRLKKAWRLLMEGGHTLAETAQKIGFSTTNSFYKSFRRVYGFSPGKVTRNSISVKEFPGIPDK